MLRLNRFILVLLCSFSTQFAVSQYAWDIGGNLGCANYLGEIGGGASEARDWVLDMKLNQTRWNPGVFVRYRADYNIGVNMSLNYFRIQGADSLTENPNRFTRNLHFRNDVFELAAVGEYYFFSQPDVGRTGRNLLDFKAYVFAVRNKQLPLAAHSWSSSQLTDIGVFQKLSTQSTNILDFL